MGNDEVAEPILVAAGIEMEKLGDQVSWAECMIKLGTVRLDLGGEFSEQGFRDLEDGLALAMEVGAMKSLESAGVNVDHIEKVDTASGHAIIQVNPQGENSIVLHGGANHCCSLNQLEQALDSSDSVAYLLMQNECNLVSEAFDLALKKGIKVVLNPAPMTSNIAQLPLDKLDTLIVNQGEAEALSGQTELDLIIEKLQTMAPNTRVIITLGDDGAILISNGGITRMTAPTVNVVDTTGAGDTFVGYFLAGLVKQLSDVGSLQYACEAASIATTLAGAIAAIPHANTLNFSA